MKYELTKPQIIDGFNVLKMKQEIQEKIYREIEGMTNEEINEYFQRGSTCSRKEMELLRNKK
jgi:hypothetical protein